MAFEVFSGVDPSAFPENRGRIDGSKNAATARRDEAVAKGAYYVAVNGMKLNEASNLAIKEFHLYITTAHMAKLIREYRRTKSSS